LTLARKIELFNEFYNLTYDEQSALLISFIKVNNPKRRRQGKTDATSRRFCSFKYYIDDSQVCKDTFLNTFNITRRRVMTLQDKIKSGILIPKDGRGKHSNRPHAIDAPVKDLIRQRIYSLSRQPSHYSRLTTDNLQCLSPDLNLCKLYRSFKNKYPNINTSQRIYNNVFQSEFKLRFGYPRSDTCKQCDFFYNKLIAADTEEERKKIEIDSMLHHSRAEQSYDALKKDTEFARLNSSTVVLCVDLQQVLFCPTLTHSNMFYQRQLSNYNFAIHNMGNNAVSMHLWYECIAKRGSLEIASCILNFIESNFNILVHGEERKLIIWSDRCVGQNNNWRILNVYSYLVSCKYFTEIHQKFLSTGHSFLPCDRDFALIEKQKKTAKVLVPSQWKYVIANARLEKPFTIVEMSQIDFKDFSSLEKDMTKKKLKITQAMWLKLSADAPMHVSIRESHNTLRPWKSHEIRHNNFGENILSIKDLPPAYQCPLALTKKKKKDLLDMCKYIPQKYSDFFKSLPG